MDRIRLGVLVSGGGSNLQSIIDSIESGEVPAEIAVVISNTPDAYGLTRARNHGIPIDVVNHVEFESRTAFDSRLVEILREYGVDLVVLAGFMRIVTGVLIDAFPNRIMNIHPALLPSFPGTHVWRDQIDYGVKFAGCTVHFVDEGMDSGPIVIQAVVPVMDDDTADTLAERILRQEHRIYPKAIRLFAENRLRIEGRRVLVLPRENLEDGTFLVNPAA